MGNKKNVILMAIGAITLIVVTLGATYAYFVSQGVGEANIDTNVITGTTDLLSFSFGSEININATEENFGQGMGNLSDSTTAQALLRANNTTNSVTTRYNIYLVIESNDFEYTTENGTPEILLNVTDPNGNLVENITGLVHYENGFDITTRTGGFLLIPDYVISANENQTVQDWNIEVTFVNLDSDQQANTNKTLTGKIYMTQDTMSSYELTQINNIDATTTYNSITVTPEVTAGSAAVERYYYGIEETTSTMAYNSNDLTRLSNALAAVEDVEFIESDEASYTFSNLEANSTYTVYSYTVDENNIKSNVYSTEVTTSEYELPTIDSVSHNVTLNSITVNITASNGSNNILKYMYKINDNEWIETESNSYTFNNLLDTTEYDIRIKVVDSNNQESTEYYEAITTEVYILPVVATVNAETTWNSITLTPTGTNGTNIIDHYEYSIDNGQYQESNKFNNLTDNTEYMIRVKAVDTVGRESNPYTLQITTDEYILPTISVSTSSTSDSITINVNATPGDGNIVSYHYSRDDGSNYTNTSSNSYTFTNLSPNTTYYLKVYVTDSNGRTSSEYSANITTKDPTYLADYIINTVYTGTDGDNDIYFHDASLKNGAQDNSYRYSGANPNNYVCFGATGETCQNGNNQYRIIGVFNNEVKLIKATNYGNYAWDKSSNIWNEMTKPDIDKTLNTTYYNALGNEWQNLIVESTWQVGGMEDNSTYTAKQYYDVEVGTEQSGYVETTKIGLMYVSDFGYGASPEKWTLAVSSSSSNYGTDNWLYLGSNEWFISRDSTQAYAAFNVSSYSGRHVASSDVYTSFAVRPSFYLESSVVLEEGSGTSTDPYILSVN